MGYFDKNQDILYVDPAGREDWHAPWVDFSQLAVGLDGHGYIFDMYAYPKIINMLFSRDNISCLYLTRLFFQDEMEGIFARNMLAYPPMDLVRVSDCVPFGELELVDTNFEGLGDTCRKILREARTSPSALSIRVAVARLCCCCPSPKPPGMMNGS